MSRGTTPSAVDRPHVSRFLATVARVAAEQHPYRERAPAPLPSDTTRIKAPPRTLPRSLRRALVFDEGLWNAAWFTFPYVLLAAPGDFASTVPAKLLVVATSAFVALTLLGMFRARLRFVRLLEHGVVAPAELVTRTESRRGSCEETRKRVLSGWRREIESYDGPTLRVTLRVGLADGPTCEIIREGGEWGGDLCLFDPENPKHHVLIEELPAFVGLGPKPGWAHVAPAWSPRGSRYSVAAGMVATAFALALIVVVPVLLLAGLTL